jgi:hypothetical protein
VGKAYLPLEFDIGQDTQVDWGEKLSGPQKSDRKKGKR